MMLKYEFRKEKKFIFVNRVIEDQVKNSEIPETTEITKKAVKQGNCKFYQ